MLFFLCLLFCTRFACRLPFIIRLRIFILPVTIPTLAFFIILRNRLKPNYILFIFLLLHHFTTYSLCSAVRKINELVKRVRICKVHAYIISHLKEQMPMMMGFSKKQKEVYELIILCIYLFIYSCIYFVFTYSFVNILLGIFHIIFDYMQKF